METTKTSGTSGKDVSAREANKRKQRALQIWFNVLVVLVTAIALGLIVWIFFIAPIKDADAVKLAAGANLALVLAPILAAAAGVERSLETIFNIIESSWKSLIANLGKGLRWLDAAEKEVYASRQWLADVSMQYNEQMKMIKLGEHQTSANASDSLQKQLNEAEKLLDLAEQRLQRAESNLAGVVSSDGYKNVKTAATIVLGLILGMIVATIGQLQMFAMMGVGGVPPRVDVFVTGLVIGSGSYPVHSLVGILQQTKDTLDKAKGYLGQIGSQKKNTNPT